MHIFAVQNLVWFIHWLSGYVMKSDILYYCSDEQQYSILCGFNAWLLKDWGSVRFSTALHKNTWTKRSYYYLSGKHNYTGFLVTIFTETSYKSTKIKCFLILMNTHNIKRSLSVLCTFSPQLVFIKRLKT